MNSREAFEAAAKRHSFGLVSLDKQISPGCLGNGEYLSPITRQIWSSWQAAERGMLERCVAVFSSKYPEWWLSDEAQDKLKELLNEQH